jgi:3-hydroxybutyryl-CoA dehydratase
MKEVQNCEYLMHSFHFSRFILTTQVQRNFTPDDVSNFGILISDNNPIHQPTTGESPQIVHGMLTASIFSSIFGTLIPGSIYRSQTLLFHSPVYADETIIGRVQVTNVKNMKKRGLMVTCNTNVYKNYDWNDNITDCDDAVTCISGHAIVWLPNIKVSDF